MSGIQYLPYQQVNKTLWDACIDSADNGLVYALSSSLDAMTTQWDALVLGNYEMVMPLPFRKKYGIAYLYQPTFLASLGVFGKQIDAGTVADFLRAIPAHFKYWDISLNAANYFSIEGYNLHQRMNYILPLQSAYEKLYAAYRENIQRNIKKCNSLGCSVIKNFPVEQVITLAREANYSTVEDLTNFANWYQQLHQQQRAVTYGIQSADGQLLASCVWVLYRQRATYLLVGNHHNGRTLGASHALIDAFIQDHASGNYIIDFEGSDIRNLAFFYSSFAAVEEPYPGLLHNRLPWWVKWLKG